MSAAHCLYCEESLPPGANFCPSCGALVSRCPACHSLVFNEAYFCGVCGTDLREHDMGPNDMVRRARVGQPRLDEATLAHFQRALEGEHVGLLYRSSRPTEYYVLEAGDNTIGAGPNNDVVIGDPAISWNHALVLCRADKYIVQDTASTNGTFVNSIRVRRPIEIGHGDVIRLADIDFVFWLPAATR